MDDNPFDSESPLYKDADIDYSCKHNPDEYYYRFTLIAKGEQGVILAARDLLGKLICGLRTSRYYVVRYVYDMLSEPLDAVRNHRSDIDLNTSMDGNYEGTRCHLVLEHADIGERTRGEIEREYNELIKDTRTVEVSPNSREFANQKKRNELLKEYRATLPVEMQLAVYLHRHLCRYTPDQCGWGNEIIGVRDDWNMSCHKEYLEMAKAMIEACPNIDLIKQIIKITHETRYGLKGE